MPADKGPLVDLDDLARLLVAHEGPPNARRRPTPSRSGARTAGVVAVGALVAGSGLGFGLGTSLTSSETASAAAVGTRFLPARGWTVLQSDTLPATGAARAIAANVPLDPSDTLDALPSRTLASLPERGIVIVATFTSRGNAEVDFAFPVRSLPLQIPAAEQREAEYTVRAGIRATNVEARIFFGRTPPTARMIAVAQGQLDRLAVAAERVTLFAKPTIADGTTPVELFGSVDNGREGETVTIQAKDCGTSFFRTVEGVETRPGGGWSTPYYPGIATTLRAVWNDNASPQVTVRQRTRVTLVKRPSGRTLYVAASGRRSFWRKQVLIQRRHSNRWLGLKTVVLTETSAMGGYYASSGAGAEFTAAVPKGTLLRAVLPRSQAPPCYLGGVSRTVRW